MATFERHEGRNLKGIDPDTKDRDLEQYGVWVKAEPQDIFEEPEGESLSPFSGETEEKTVPNESFLTEEEEELLDAVEKSSESPEKSFEESGDIPKIPDIADFESLEDLGVPIEEFSPDSGKSSPEETEFQEIPDFNLEEPESALEAGSSSDFESVDIDLKFDDTLPPLPASKTETTSQGSASSSGGFETVTDFDDFLNNPESQELELPGESATESSSLEEGLAKTDDFSLDDIPDIAEAPSIDDVAELEKELSIPVDHLESAGAASDNVSSEILLKIAGELSSIKQELVSLKSQIAAIKAESAGGRPEAAAEGGKTESSKAGGFFDEEEDETIALTGDELDNILNTAEFSEESADTGIPEEITEPSDVPDALGDLLPESGDYAQKTAEPGIEELSLPPADGEVPMTSDESAIAALAKEGVSPLTPPPEDTSYLEESASEADGALPEAPLLEPTPEELDIEDLVEDGFEDAEELPLADFESPKDLEEPAELIEETEELEELTLDVDSEPSPIVLEAPEHVEMPIPEMEGAPVGTEESFPEFVEEISDDSVDGLGEIALHNEETPGPVASEPAEISELEEIDLSEPKPAKEASPEASPEDLLVEEVAPSDSQTPEPVPNRIKDEVRSVLSYLDKLLESLPEEKIEEFAKSEHFETYKRLFEELGLV